MGLKKYILTKGDRFGDLEFLGEFKSVDRRKLGLYKCDCGNEKWIRVDRVSRGDVKTCGCKSPTRNWGDHVTKHKDNYCYYILAKISEKNANNRGIEWNLTIEDLVKQYNKQDGECVYTGEKLILPISFTDKTNASIDRIDSDLGYCVDNIQFVTKTVNFAKLTLSHNNFIELCKIVAKRFL